MDPWGKTLFGFSQPVRRKVFISHYHGHREWTDAFLRDFGDVFIRRSVGAFGDDNLINSGNPEYVMRRIRDEYIGDSTITIVLVGNCTHSRRYIDWEIKGSLKRASDGMPNGLLAIQCSSNPVHLPPRFGANWNSDNLNCYARFYRYPQSKEELRSWIEDAFVARSQRSNFIRNKHDTMMGYNARCKVCTVTH
jgi:hypothetical protein